MLWKVVKVGVAVLAFLIFYFCFGAGYNWTSKWEWEVQSYIEEGVSK